tara:strand:+ start:4711 stop:5112 length:402 start_codon:yes stop_codon:yes gene_type:complete
MAYIPFNGATLSWEGSNYEITSFSMEGGTRAEIDITHSGSTRRQQIPGMASARTLTFGFNYAGNADTLHADLTGCASGTLVVGLGDGCSDTDILTVNAWLMSWDLSGDLDGLVTGNMSFMVAEGGAVDVPDEG